jgi:hypothetical protein
MNVHDFYTLAILSPLAAVRAADVVPRFLMRDIRYVQRYFRGRKTPRYYSV